MFQPGFESNNKQPYHRTPDQKHVRDLIRGRTSLLVNSHITFCVYLCTARQCWSKTSATKKYKKGDSTRMIYRSSIHQYISILIILDSCKLMIQYTSVYFRSHISHNVYILQTHQMVFPFYETLSNVCLLNVRIHVHIHEYVHTYTFVCQQSLEVRFI